MTNVESVFVALRALGWEGTGNSLNIQRERQESMRLVRENGRIKAEISIPGLSSIAFSEDCGDEKLFFHIVYLWDFFKQESRKRNMTLALWKRGWNITFSNEDGIVLFMKTGNLITSISFDEHDLVVGKAVIKGRLIHSYNETILHQGDSEPDRLAAMHQRNWI